MQTVGVLHANVIASRFVHPEGLCNVSFLKKSKLITEVGGWVHVSRKKIIGKSSNIFGVAYHVYSICTLLKVVSYYDASVLSMSVNMCFQSLDRGGGGLGGSSLNLPSTAIIFACTGCKPQPTHVYQTVFFCLCSAQLDGGVAPEWLSERSHDSGRQSNAAVDIGLKVARVGDDGAQVGEFVNKFDIIVADM